MGAAGQRDLDVAGGEAPLADAVDRVVADRVGGVVAVVRVQAAGEAAVDDVGEDRQRDVAWIDRKARKRAKDRLRQLTSHRWGVSMERRIQEINRFTVGWTAYYRLADTPGRLKTSTNGSDDNRGRSGGRNGSVPERGDATCERWISTSRTPDVGVLTQGILADRRLPGPLLRPAQRLQDQPRLARFPRFLPPFPGCDANRPVRTRTPGGVGGVGVNSAYPIRSGVSAVTRASCESHTGRFGRILAGSRQSAPWIMRSFPVRLGVMIGCYGRRVVAS